MLPDQRSFERPPIKISYVVICNVCNYEDILISIYYDLREINWKNKKRDIL